MKDFVRIGTTISPRDKKKLDKLVKRHGTTKAAIIRLLVTTYVHAMETPRGTGL